MTRALGAEVQEVLGAINLERLEALPGRRSMSLPQEPPAAGVDRQGWIRIQLIRRAFGITPARRALSVLLIPLVAAFCWEHANRPALLLWLLSAIPIPRCAGGRSSKRSTLPSWRGYQRAELVSRWA